MTEEGRFCTESSSMGDMTCQNAWDDDIVTDTIWHPGSSGLDEYTTIYVNRKVIITKVTVKQYKWETGYASKMSLNINGDIKKMRPVNKNDFEIMGKLPGGSKEKKMNDKMNAILSKLFYCQSILPSCR